MSSPQQHVVVGAGPVGAGIALRLAERGDRVKLVTRSGTTPGHAGIEAVRGDATDAAFLTRTATGAASLVNAANPPYTSWPTTWPPLHAAFLAAAEATGARLVMMENLYGYGRPAHPGGVMLDNDPLAPCSAKGAVRARMAEEMFALHAAGRIRATSARASDFFGPGVGDAQLGERGMTQLLNGKAVDAIGNPDLPHTITYLPDVIALLEVLIDDDHALGRAWHVPSAPAISVRAAWEQLARAAGVGTPKLRTLRGLGLTMVGLVMPVVRELKEISYQFDGPWVMDSSDATSTFGLHATPLDVSIPATAAWWKARLGAGRAAA